MGLFVTDDGQYHSWIAAVLCCCAAVGEDEFPVQLRKDQEAQRELDTVCNDQPVPLRQLHALHNTTTLLTSKNDTTDESVANTSDYQHGQASHSFNATSPLDQHDSLRLSRTDLQRARPASLSHGHLPNISAPSSFRRTELTFEQRLGLTPLRLGPVVLRDTSATAGGLTNVSAVDDLRMLRSDHRHSSLLRSASSAPTLTGSHSAHESVDQKSFDFHSPYIGSSQASTVIGERQRISSGAVSSRASSISSQHHRGTSSVSSIPSKAPSIEQLRAKHRKSLSSLRRNAEDEDNDLEREILELNTIVEERRTEGGRALTPTQHVPAIAPAMRVHARSETLTDIGSALSLPRSARTPLAICSRASLPPLPSSIHARPTRSRSVKSLHRISGWLSSVLTPSFTTQNFSSATLQQRQSFYKCRPSIPHPEERNRRPSAVSSASFSASFESLVSPSLTVASTPTITRTRNDHDNRGHIRSQAGESQLLATTSTSSHYRHDHPQHRRISTVSTSRNSHVPEEIEGEKVTTPGGGVVDLEINLSEVGLAF